MVDEAGGASAINLRVVPVIANHTKVLGNDPHVQLAVAKGSTTISEAKDAGLARQKTLAQVGTMELLL
jgi:hypothetical protein